MFERRHEPLLPRFTFILRMARSVGGAVGIVLLALGTGVLGYHQLENMAWIDALLNAAMILSGMGPVGELHTPGGKLFASIYALLSGFVFLTVAGILFAPLLHRMIHRFHLEGDGE
jgi:hypothetical protein